MQQSRAQVEDFKLEAERRLMYQGAACISLDVLQFRRDQPRELDTKHVEFLKGCFRKDACRRLPVRNHVPAVIDQQQLVEAMRNSGVSVHQLLTDQPGGYPRLDFPAGVQLECLHGRHRIQAAREFLLPTDKWWVVDLYLSDLDAHLKTSLVEEYSNELKPTDGEIYRKIRQYDSERNISSKMRWKARLKGIRPKSLNTLLKHEDITDAFDALLDIPGLWDGMMLSTIHKLFPMRCNEEIVHYLHHIKRVWSDLVRGDRNAMLKIDKATVKALQLRAPRASTTDAKLLRSQLREGEIFSTFTDRERDDIWSRLQMVEGLVPSLFTFFKDVQYLEVCVNCVKRLTALSPGQSVSYAMKRRFTGANQEQRQVKVQVTEDAFTHRQGTRADQADLGYRQIYAFAMRHWPDMPKEPEKEDPVKKPATQADPAVLRRSADLADNLGFESPEITTLKPYPSSRSARGEYPHSRPLLVTSGRGVLVARRCGKPRTRAYEEDRQSLFIDHLLDERQDQAEGVTSFFVRKSVYLAFFDRPLTTHSYASGHPNNHSPNPHSQSLGGSPYGPGLYEPNRSRRNNGSPSRGAPQHVEEDLDGILSLHEQREATSQHGAHSNNAEGGTPEQAEGSGDADSMPDWLEEQEHGRLEQRRLEVQERERKEKEDLEKERRERLARQKLERKRVERERQEHERSQRQKAREQERQEQEVLEQGRMERELLERNRVEREGQASVEDRNDVREGVDSSQPTGRDQRRVTQLDLEGIIADGLASISEGPNDQLQSSQAAGDLEELVDSYRNLIGTENVDGDRQQHEQTPDRQLQIIPAAPSEVRIEFKIHERDVWRTDRSLLVDLSDPSEVERVAKKYMRKGIRPFDSSFNLLVPRTCFQAATADGSNTILLIPENNMEVNNQLVVFVPNAMPETELPEGARQKRGRR